MYHNVLIVPYACIENMTTITKSPEIKESISVISLLVEWRIIARWSSVFPGVVHADDFRWLMFVHERFSASEQTLNTQKHLSGLYKGKHEIKVQ